MTPRNPKLEMSPNKKYLILTDDLFFYLRSPTGTTWLRAFFWPVFAFGASCKVTPAHEKNPEILIFIQFCP